MPRNREGIFLFEPKNSLIWQIFIEYLICTNYSSKFQSSSRKKIRPNHLPSWSLHSSLRLQGDQRAKEKGMIDRWRVLEMRNEQDWKDPRYLSREVGKFLDFIFRELEGRCWEALPTSGQELGKDQVEQEGLCDWKWVLEENILKHWYECGSVWSSLPCWVLVVRGIQGSGTEEDVEMWIGSGNVLWQLANLG